MSYKWKEGRKEEAIKCFIINKISNINLICYNQIIGLILYTATMMMHGWYAALMPNCCFV